MPKPTTGDLLNDLTSLLELDMEYDPTTDSDKLASVKDSDSLTGDKTASVVLQDEIAEALAEYEKTAGGNLNPFPSQSGSGAKGTQAQQTVQVRGGGRSTETPGRGTEAAAQTDSSGLKGATGATDTSDNDSTDSSGMPGAGQEAAAAKTAYVQLGLVAQGLLTDLTEGAIESAVEEAMEEHTTKLAAARKRLTEGSNRLTEGETEDSEDDGTSEEESNEKQASYSSPGNRFLAGR